MMFAPFYLMDAFAGARIANTSDNKALVASTKKLLTVNRLYPAPQKMISGIC